MGDDQLDGCEDCTDCARFAAERDRLNAEADSLENNDLPRLQRERDGALLSAQAAVDRAAAAESAAHDAVIAAETGLLTAESWMGGMTGEETAPGGDAVRRLSAKQDKATRTVAAVQARINQARDTLSQANANEVAAQGELADAQAAFDATVATYNDAINELLGRIDDLRNRANEADAKWRECCAACKKAKSMALKAFVGAGLLGLLGLIFIGIGATSGSSTSVTTAGSTHATTTLDTTNANGAGATLSSGTPAIIGGSVCVSTTPPTNQGPTTPGGSLGSTTPGATPGVTATNRYVTVNIVINSDASGPWVARLNAPPNNIYATSGMVSGGIGSFTFYNPPLTTYQRFSAVNSSGQIVEAGALSPLFPYVVSSNNQPCQQLGATVPTFGSTAAESSATTNPVPAGPAAVAIRYGSGTNWGLLGTGLGLVVVGGAAGATGRRLRMHGVPEDATDTETPQTVADDGQPSVPVEPAQPGSDELTPTPFEWARNLAQVRKQRGDEVDEAPDPSAPIILANKGKLYNDIVHDRAAAQAAIDEELNSVPGSFLNYFGWNRTVNYAQTVIARCDDEKKDFDEREKLHGTVGAANMLWDEREQQWSTYRWAIFNCFAIPIANAFGGMQAAAGNILQIVGQLLGNLSSAPDEVVEWVTGEDPNTSGGVPWRKVFGIGGVTFGILGGAKAAWGHLPKPPKSQVNVPRGRIPLGPPPLPAAPGAGRRMAPIPPPMPVDSAPPPGPRVARIPRPMPRVAPIPPPMPVAAKPTIVTRAQYHAEHQAIAAQIKKDIAGMNVAAESVHWSRNRNVNCPYTALAADQQFAGTPMRGIPPFKHTDGISFLETHYGGQFKPTSVATLRANLLKNPGSRGIVYVAWRPSPGKPPGSNGAHVFNVISAKGKTGVHVFIVDAQTGEVDPAHFQKADPRYTHVLRTH